MLTNEVRRTKIKLDLLDTPNLAWVIHDLMCGFGAETGQYPDKPIKYFLERLKTQYEEFIKDNTPQDSKQLKVL